MEPASPLWTPELRLREGPGRSASKAFTLIELLVVIAVVAILIAITLPALFKARKAGRLTQCQSNFRAFGTGIASYASDNADRLLSFTWQPDEGPYPTEHADLRASVRSPETAINRQATHLIRRLTDQVGFGPNSGWFPAVNYLNLVLEDYLGNQHDPSSVCPEHVLLLQGKSWRRQQGHADRTVPFPDWPWESAHWGFGSSYSPTIAMFTNDHAVNRCVYGQGSEWGTNRAWGSVRANPKCIGRRRLSEVSFPSNKVAMWEHADRHLNKGGYFFLYEASRQPYLFFDGSVRLYTTGDMNLGSHPQVVDTPGFPQWVSAGPATSVNSRFEANFMPGDTEVVFASRCVTTRLGLKGVDVGGEEVYR